VRTDEDYAIELPGLRVKHLGRLSRPVGGQGGQSALRVSKLQGPRIELTSAPARSTSERGAVISGPIPSLGERDSLGVMEVVRSQGRGGP